MTVAYKITKSGARSRSAQSLIFDKNVMSEMAKTGKAFDKSVEQSKQVKSKNTITTKK